MTPENFNRLASSYSYLFSSSGIRDIEVGDGWYNILDVLFSHITATLSRAEGALAHAIRTDKGKLEIDHCVGEVNYQKTRLPKISQIKEKFGGLRVYYDTDEDSVYISDYVDFAESMSTRTCEVCGAPGSVRGSRWLKAVCDHHHEENEKLMAP